MATLSYPTTRYTPTQLLDLSSKTVREEHTPAAARTFFNIMSELKHDSNGKVLDSERLYRISYLIGIYKALRILYSKDLANRFVHLPNSNRMFNGSTPLEYMQKGGLLAMQNVRRLLDARRGGV